MVDAKKQAEKRSFEHYLLPRFATYRSAVADKGIAAVYKDLAEYEIRNDHIIKDVVKALADGRTPIVLTERREHVLLLADKLASIVRMLSHCMARHRRSSAEKRWRNCR